MCNIAEGADSGSTKKFIRFLNIAKASVAEVRSDLYVALDLDDINSEQFEVLRDHALEVTKLTAGLRTSLLRKSESS